MEIIFIITMFYFEVRLFSEIIIPITTIRQKRLKKHLLRYILSATHRTTHFFNVSKKRYHRKCRCRRETSPFTTAHSLRYPTRNLTASRYIRSDFFKQNARFICKNLKEILSLHS